MHNNISIDTVFGEYLGVSVPEGVFTANAVYRENMDFIEYMTRDEVTISDRIDPFLTLIWNFQQDEVVGFKLKGFRYVHDKIYKKDGDSNRSFIEIAPLLEQLIAEVGQQVLDGLKAEARREAYEQAINLARRTKATIDWQLAA